MAQIMKTIALFLETNGDYGREFLKGVAQCAHEHKDWRLKLLSLTGIEDAAAFDGCDGIIARAAEAETFARLKATGLPIIDAFCQMHDPDLIGVDLDHRCVGRLAAEFFLRHGFVHFAYCGYRGTRYSDEYLESYAAALAARGFGCNAYALPEPPCDVAFFDDKPRRPKHPQRLAAWLRSLPSRTAVFCATDLRAYHVVATCQRIGRDVPNDIAVIGVDNDTVLGMCTTPTISSIDPNAFAIGYAAARFLSAAMKNPVGHLKPRAIHRVKPRGIVERESTAVYPVTSDWLAKVLLHIDANLASPLASSELERVSGVSHTALNKAFRKSFGVSARRYVLETKMREARRLLETEGWLVKQVAASTGFVSPKYFCHAYHTYYGHPPSCRPRAAGGGKQGHT